MLKAAVICVTAGTQIRARQADVAKARTIGSAPQRVLDRCQSLILDREARILDKVKILIDYIGHVSVLLCNRNRHRIRSVFFIHDPDRLFKCLAAGIKEAHIVVSKTVFDNGLLGAAFQSVQEIEALISLGMVRRLGRREHPIDFACDGKSIHHDIFGRTRMNRYAANRKDRTRGIKILIFELALRPAVDRIGKVSAKSRYVEMIGAFSQPGAAGISPYT